MNDEIRSRVLLLDDEEMVTRNLELLLKMEQGFETVAFNRPEAALDYLQGEAVDVMLVDFIMPDMNGLDFLARAKELRPGSTRVLLTGYADKESAVRAINEVGLYQYLEKPWDNDLLLVTLRNAAERAHLVRQLGERTTSLEEIRDRLWRMLV